MSRPPGSILLLDGPVGSLDEYVEGGGGRALAAALQRSPGETIEEVRRSGLRGRGGAGFPTGIKWRTVHEDPCPTKYVVCNAAATERDDFEALLVPVTRLCRGRNRTRDTLSYAAVEGDEEHGTT